MAKINLLPWRDELRKARQKEFVYMLMLASLVGLVLAGSEYMYFKAQLADQQSANASLVNEISALDQQLTSLEGMDKQKQEMSDRIKAVYALQGDRPVVVHLFEEVAKAIPNNLYLTKFERKGDKFFVEGRADSPATVSAFLRNIETSPWYRNAFMSSFQQKEDPAAQAAAPIAAANTAPQNVQVKSDGTVVAVPAATPSSTAAGVPQQQAGSVLPRPEESYGTFSMLMDLEKPDDGLSVDKVKSLVLQGVK